MNDKKPEALRLADALDSKNERILTIEANRAANELRKLYELNEVLLEKCHTLEKMVEYKVEHIFDVTDEPPKNDKYVLTGYLKTIVDIDKDGKETYIDEPFYTIKK